MITKDYLNEFNSPIRQINGKAELYTGSATSTMGEGEITKEENLTNASFGYVSQVVMYGRNLTQKETKKVSEGENYVSMTNGLLKFNFVGGTTNSLVINGAKFTLPAGTYTYSSTYLRGETTKTDGSYWCGFYGADKWGPNEARVLGFCLGGKWPNYNKNQSKTFTLTEPTELFFRVLASGTSTETCDCEYLIQLEYGDIATPFEEPKEKQTFIANLGKVEINNPYVPTSTFIAAASGAMRPSYSLTTGYVNTFAHTDALKSITIDRAGEPGKFFGFGIGQKATINILDKYRALNVDEYNYFKIDFRLNENDFVGPFPAYFVSEAKRDEKTNELTITASDKLEQMNKDTVDALRLEAPYTIRDCAAAVAELYGLSLNIRDVEDESVFDTDYPTGANLEGTEKIRSLANAIAEATQTIYFISGEYLVFKRLNKDAAIDLNIEKEHYFSLESKPPHILGAICHATELGDNVISSAIKGETQYVRDNPFWELRDDIADIVENAAAAIAGISITPFTCSWRGNFLLEPGDKIAITTKDNNIITSFLLVDKLTYNGGFSQSTEWSYEDGGATAANPSTLGEVLKQTYARVDKANKQIDIVAGESSANKEAIASLQINEKSINATVSDLEKAVKDNQENVDGELTELKKQVSTQITPEAMTIAIQAEMSKGTDKVITSTGYEFNEEGLTVSKSTSEISTQITENGMTVNKGSEEMLTANKEGVKAQDLHATTFLIIGRNSRFEDFGNRTACFWIGG